MSVEIVDAEPTLSTHNSASPLTRIVAILPRGEAIRNFVYSGALDEVKASADLTVLSVAPNEEIWSDLEQRYGRVERLQGADERWVVRVLREGLDIAHGRWLWSAAAQERWRVHNLEARHRGGRLKRALKKLTWYPFSNRSGVRVLEVVERFVSRLFRASDFYEHLYRELKPSLVFNASQVHGKEAMQAVQAARWLGVPTAAFVFSWDNLTSQGRIIPSYDYYMVWNEPLRDQLLRIYPSVAPDRVIVTGTPQFDFHFRPEFHWGRDEFCARVGADRHRPIVIYTTGMANHMPGEPQIVEGIANLLQQMTDLGPPQLLVRVYPKDRTGRFEELKARRRDILFPEAPWEPENLTPTFEDAYLLTNTLRHAAVGINVASTISLELCMLDKPVINVAYHPEGVDSQGIDFARYYEFDHYRPVVESGAVQVVWSEREMRDAIHRALTRPGEQWTQRINLINSLFGRTLDGFAAHQFARSILDLSNSK